ncbi:ergosterol biosynthesis protein [Coniosporium tulheliwenetii]|uniref:Ergosterol biosynthesis protein n=1 Tax=Coniosporium tulheliwenetii TaxID=3383036 RepID=A0ACC2YKS1_9PEZI|nr:ergosterol biosynthesis protein [Cladosporium sp. JES 115]
MKVFFRNGCFWYTSVSIVSVANSIQAYAILTYTARVYSGTTSPTSKNASLKPSPTTPNLTTVSPVTPLSARTFGTWTLLSSIIRLYAAYHIDNPVVYQLALWTYAVAGFHFFSEWLYFGTARWGAGLAGPVFVSTGSLAWMLSQWGWYVR